jgi:hypothetical protein
MKLKNLSDKSLQSVFTALHNEYLDSTYKGITGEVAEVRYARLREEMIEVIEELEMRRKKK